MNVNINVFNKHNNVIKDKNTPNITITLIESKSTQQNIKESIILKIKGDNYLWCTDELSPMAVWHCQFMKNSKGSHPKVS